MNRSQKIKKITGLGIMTALVVVLTLFSNLISFGSVSINLALIPIVIGACIYGPIEGMFLGIVNGIIVLTAPQTLGFLTYNPIITVILCLVKTGVAGLVAGLLFKLLKNKFSNDLIATIITSLAVPILNTGIYLLGCIIFYLPHFETIGEALGLSFNPIGVLMYTTFTSNFIIEFVSTVVLSPAVHRIINYYSSKNKKSV